MFISLQHNKRNIWFYPRLFAILFKIICENNDCKQNNSWRLIWYLRRQQYSNFILKLEIGFITLNQFVYKTKAILVSM